MQLGRLHSKKTIGKQRDVRKKRTSHEFEEQMEWIKKHTDTVIIVTAIASSMLWMNGKFNDIDKQFSEIEKEIAIIKTVLVMRNILPAELANHQEEK